MIYNEEYARKIRLGKSIPPELWIIRTALFQHPITESEWYKEWEAQVMPVKITWHKYSCAVCGTPCCNYRPDTLCFDCRCWAERQRNGQINLFE